MHGDALAAGRVADDGVARHRLAAGRDLGENSLLAMHQHAWDRLDVGNQGDGAQIAARDVQAGRHAHHDRMGGQVSVADRRQEVVDRAVLVQRGDLAQLLVVQVGEVHAVHAVELFVEQVAALGHVLLPALAFEPLPDALLGGRALDEVEPVAARAVRALGGQHLNDLSVLQRVVERHHAPVDLGADAPVPDLGVNPVREVDRR